MSDAIRRICVVRMGGMGDILLATPAIRALSQHFNTTDIDFIVGRKMAPALEGIPYLREVISFDKDGADAHFSRFMSFLGDIRRRNYDLFVNFQPSAKTALMMLASGARHRILFHKDRRKQKETGRVRHAIDDFTKELKPLGIESVVDRRMDFFVPDAAYARVSSLLAGADIGPGDTLLVVNPAATRDINRWPPEKFVAFLQRMSREMPQVRVVLSGGPGDVKLVREIVDAVGTSGAPVNFAGKVSVKELGALLSRADVFLTGDTGPLHIASAVGAPIVCLSGAADPDRTGPTGQTDLVVINRELSCVPCQGRTCKRGDIACMTQMPVDWVMDSVQRRLKSRERQRRRQTV